MTSWLLVLIALIGAVLNVQMNRLGFLFWIVSNCGLAIVNASRRQWAQAVLFTVYFGLALWGWLVWK